MVSPATAVNHTVAVWPRHPLTGLFLLLSLTDTQTERQRGRQRQTDKQTQRETEADRERDKDRQTGRQKQGQSSVPKGDKRPLQRTPGNWESL